MMPGHAENIKAKIDYNFLESIIYTVICRDGMSAEIGISCRDLGTRTILIICYMEGT